MNKTLGQEHRETEVRVQAHAFDGDPLFEVDIPPFGRSVATYEHLLKCGYAPEYIHPHLDRPILRADYEAAGLALPDWMVAPTESYTDAWTGNPDTDNYWSK